MSSRIVSHRNGVEVQRHRKQAALALVGVCALLLGACISGSNNNDVPVPTAPSDPSDPSDPGAQSRKDLYFSGTVAYSYQGSSATLSADNVCNGRINEASDDIIMTLRFTTQEEPFGSGYNAAEAFLDPLPGDACYTNVSESTSFDLPPGDTYYVHMTLKELPNPNTVVDYRTFDNQVTICNNGCGNDCSTANICCPRSHRWGCEGRCYETTQEASAASNGRCHSFVSHCCN